MWQHYNVHNTFSGLQVYIEPNASYGEFLRAAGASANDFEQQDTTIPFTFMSFKEYPRAVIKAGPWEDWALTEYFKRKFTFARAPIYIEPDIELRDHQSADVITDWIQRGRRNLSGEMIGEFNWMRQ
jgi:hypothetical protein